MGKIIHATTAVMLSFMPAAFAGPAYDLSQAEFDKGCVAGPVEAFEYTGSGHRAKFTYPGGQAFIKVSFDGDQPKVSVPGSLLSDMQLTARPGKVAGSIDIKVDASYIGGACTIFFTATPVE